MAIASGSGKSEEKNNGSSAVLALDKPIWYFNRDIDYFGLGLTAFVAFCAFYWVEHFSLNLRWLPTALLVGSILVNYPHYAATYHRVYRNWDEIKSYTFETIWVPVLLLIFGVASLFSVQGLAPWYVAGYIFFSGYHYSGQSYGIAMIFTRKAGVSLNTWQRWCCLLPLFTVYLYPVVRGNTEFVPPQIFYGVMLPHFGLPAWVSTVSLGVFYISFAAYIFMNVYLAAKQNKRLPMIAHLVIGSQLLWFSVGTMVNSFNAFVPFFHCLQYLVITTYFYFREMQLKNNTAPVQDPTLSTVLQLDGMRFLSSRHFVKYYVTLIIMGALLFMTVPWAISLSGVVHINMAIPIVVSFINIHHFILDAAIWKLRRPEMSKALVN